MFHWQYAVQCVTLSIGLLSCLRAAASVLLHNSIRKQLHTPFTLIKCDNLIALYPFDHHDFSNAVPFDDKIVDGNGR